MPLLDFSRPSSDELPTLVFVSLGANIGEPGRTLRQALLDLRALADGPLWTSSLWRSAPVECPPGSPWFHNAVAAWRPAPGETPESLLAWLQQLERLHGRPSKKALNEPRPLDLDIISFANRMSTGPRLILPHPRAHLRRFVLEPLAEVAPALVLPGQSQIVAQLLKALPPGQAIELVSSAI